MPLPRRTGVLTAYGPFWLACFAAASCGGEDSSTPTGDASIEDAVTGDVGGSGTDGFASDAAAPDAGDAYEATAAADVDVAADVDAAADADAATTKDAVSPTDAVDSADAGLDCCTKPPSLADNPPVPAGYTLMPQSQVTPEMTAWAVMILEDPTTYPMFYSATRTFGTVTVLLRVEWHPPDFQNGMVHRGVTLYVPI
jgi:hypothetical protein